MTDPAERGKGRPLFQKQRDRAERGDTARSIPGDLEIELSQINALKLNAARPSSEIWTAPY